MLKNVENKMHEERQENEMLHMQIKNDVKRTEELVENEENF